MPANPNGKGWPQWEIYAVLHGVGRSMKREVMKGEAGQGEPGSRGFDAHQRTRGRQ